MNASGHTTYILESLRECRRSLYYRSWKLVWETAAQRLHRQSSTQTRAVAGFAFFGVCFLDDDLDLHTMGAILCAWSDWFVLRNQPSVTATMRGKDIAIVRIHYSFWHPCFTIEWIISAISRQQTHRDMNVSPPIFYTATRSETLVTWSHSRKPLLRWIRIELFLW